MSAAPLLDVSAPAANAKISTAMAMTASGQWDFKNPAGFGDFMAHASSVDCRASQPFGKRPPVVSVRLNGYNFANFLDAIGAKGRGSHDLFGRRG